MAKIAIRNNKLVVEPEFWGEFGGVRNSSKICFEIFEKLKNPK